VLETLLSPKDMAGISSDEWSLSHSSKEERGQPRRLLPRRAANSVAHGVFHRLNKEVQDTNFLYRVLPDLDVVKPMPTDFAILEQKQRLKWQSRPTRKARHSRVLIPRAHKMPA
jgi:hypothetical protein